MTPAEFASEIIAPTVREFRDQRDSRRRGILACVVTYSLADYLMKAGAGAVWVRGREVCADEFDIVQGVCNGSKDCRTRPQARHAFTPGGERERPRAVWGVAEWGRSIWGDEHGAVEVEHNGKTFDLYFCVKVVLETFQSQYSHHLEGVDLTSC
jgi:hypothetical protein